MPECLKLSKADARALLVRHHFAPSDIPGVFERLGSVQFDPLKPVGCNHDLVLQARVPGYRVGDWEKIAYQERMIYDAWDKQASLVRMEDWPKRRIYHQWHAAAWRKRVLEPYPEAVEILLDELRERGPLSSTEFNHQVHKPEWQGSWYGPKLTKHVLRALWHTGKIVTHHRQGNKHVYDLAERVIPSALFHAPPLNEDASLRWLIRLRHQAVGLLRPAGNAQEVWSLPIKSAERQKVIEALVAEGQLMPLELGGTRYHAVPEVLTLLDSPSPAPLMRFVAPLDQLMWDRKAVRQIFDFDYVWEVYKPEKQRTWGYYTLPVMFGQDFVARIDSRVEGTSWQVKGWWWEEGVTPDTRMLEALEHAATDFMRYLGANEVKTARSVDKRVREALKAAETPC